MRVIAKPRQLEGSGPLQAVVPKRGGGKGKYIPASAQKLSEQKNVKTLK